MAEPLRVGVVGLGLIGGSVARAVHAAGALVHGHDPDVTVADAASDEGVTVHACVADLVSAVGVDGIVVVAAPLAITHEVVAAVLDAAGDDGPTVTDVASVKGPVLAAASGHAAFVASHPMAGTEHTGWAASSSDLFAGAPWLVLVDGDADVARLTAVLRVVLATGALPVPVDPGAHDAALATISHVPHVLAAVLTLEAAGLLPLAAGSLHGAARVAAGDPALPTAMVELNRAEVDRALDALTGALTRFRSDPDPARWFADARAAWLGHRGHRVASSEHPLTPAALLAVGAAGGHVVAVGEGTFVAEVPEPAS